MINLAQCTHKITQCIDNVPIVLKGVISRATNKNKGYIYINILNCFTISQGH